MGYARCGRTGSALVCVDVAAGLAATPPRCASAARCAAAATTILPLCLNFFVRGIGLPPHEITGCACTTDGIFSRGYTRSSIRACQVQMVA